MAILQPLNQTISPTGAALTFTAVTDADELYFSNTGREIVILVNASTAANATFETPATVDTNLAIADKVVSAIGTATTYVGTFNPTLYNQSGTYGGKVKLTVAANLSVAIVSVPRV